MSASDTSSRCSLSSPSLSERLNNVRRNLRRAEDQLIDWRTACTAKEKRKTSARRSKSADNTRVLRLKYESHIHSLEDNLKRSQEKAQSERKAYTKCLGLAEQQLVELRQKFDNDRQHLCHRLIQLDDEVQRIEGILNNQLKAESRDEIMQKIDAGTLLYDEECCWENPIFTTSASSDTGIKNNTGEPRGDELGYWKDSARRLSQDTQRERLEMQKKIRTLQANVRNLKLLRHHSQLEEDLREAENFALQNERDALTIALYKLKIQQMADKLKLEKARDDLGDVLQHITMTDFDQSRKRLLMKMTCHILKELEETCDGMCPGSRTSNVESTSESRRKSTRSLLSSLKEVSVSRSFSDHIASHNKSTKPALRDTKRDGEKRDIPLQRSPRTANFRPASFTCSKPARSVSAENRRKLTVSWGGCIVLDDEELKVRPISPSGPLLPE